jgi:hypothetical protein
MESALKKYKPDIRNEIDVKSENNIQAFSAFCDELEAFASKIEKPLPRQYDVLISKQRKSVSCHGLLQSRGSSISFVK